MATRKTPASAKPATPSSTTARKATAKKAVPSQPARKKVPAKAPAQATGKPASQAAAKPAPQPAAAPKKPEAAKDKAEKARKPKMVRDSFTMPKAEYAAIDTLKGRAAKAGRPAKKSELLRAGVQLLTGLDAAALVATLKALPAIKTGRPAKG